MRMSAIEALMKQKHMIIWQRRHPDYDLTGLSKKEEYYAKHWNPANINPLLKNVFEDVPDKIANHNEAATQESARKGQSTENYS
ncbi:hypothetical protein GJ496_004177 [Pomphorhynchus laevis]|nr:hypothetical protein GJ496_004177 [Pomphorhynchus laevis]